MRPANTYHDIRERRQRGKTYEVEQWRAAGGRMYEKRRDEENEMVVRAASGERGFEIAGSKIRKLRSAELDQWRRDVRMVPANFEAHAEEMGVVSTVEGGIETLEASAERLILERDARSGVPKRVIDLRSKRSVVFDQPRDVQGRHWPRLEIHITLDRELWRDRILHVEFDAPVPDEVSRLWEALERGGAL